MSGPNTACDRAFQEIISDWPNYPDTVNGLGVALFDNGNIDESIYYFQRAIEVKPDSPYARNNLGFALQQKGRINEAVELFRQAVQIKPDFRTSPQKPG